MNDLISRRKAFEYFVTLWECIGTIMDRDEWEDVCMTTANEIPSAEPERKKGKWILHPEIKNVYGGTVIQCSECGEEYVVLHLEDEKYCRNCGAKMEAET